MALTNAERQQRFREKHGSVRAGVAAPVVVQATGSVGLTEKQIADRETLIATGSIFPIGIKYAGPLFMGMPPNEWRQCSDELVDYFGMRDARDRWRRDLTEHFETTRQANARAQQIVAELGARAAKIRHDSGAVALCQAYDADPTLGRKRQSSKMKRGRMTAA